jgi:hypothetical protein
VREQRKIVSIRAATLFNQQAVLRARNEIPLTQPISATENYALITERKILKMQNFLNLNE